VKCINCRTDNDLRDRKKNLSRCKSCNHPFVFEPTEMSSRTQMTDPLFAELLVDISARDTLFFTPRQLYYLLNSKLQVHSDNVPRGIAIVWRLFSSQLIFNKVVDILFFLIGTPVNLVLSVPRQNVGIIAYIILQLTGYTFAILLFILLSAFMFGISIAQLLILLIALYPILLALIGNITSTILLVSFIAVLILWEAELTTSRRLSQRIRQERIGVLIILAGVLLSIGVAVAIVVKSSPFGIMAICLGLNALWLSYKGQRQLNNIYTANSNLLIDRTEFDRWLNKWMSINDRPAKILPPPETYSLPATTNPQVPAYSFDLAIVCDNPAIAQILISNNFHFENNCAILTIDGYPQNIFDGTMEILYRNPNLKVYAFHDCTPNGIKLARQLRSSEAWFPNPAIPIIDVGILPRQIVNNLDVMTLQSQKSAQLAKHLDPDLRASLNRAELAWLDAGCYLELESFSTQKLIHILRRAISETRDLGTVEYGNVIRMDRNGFYTAENFGWLYD
jgi:hypothetical protein